MSAARSALVTTMAQPPSDVMAQSRRWNGSATMRDSRMSAGVNGPRPWYTASGLTCPLLRTVAATVASCSGVVPCMIMCRRAMRANSAAVNSP